MTTVDHRGTWAVKHILKGATQHKHQNCQV
jgi:hypothetical protein